jgi:hypothetical protein
VRRQSDAEPHDVEADHRRAGGRDPIGVRDGLVQGCMYANVLRNPRSELRNYPGRLRHDADVRQRVPCVPPALLLPGWLPGADVHD